MKHPCMECGACCAAFKVLLQRTEISELSLRVPEELTQSISSHSLAMIGTLQDRPRCVALKGEIGQAVSCEIYERRPSCCRNFRASYENGLRNRRCDKARAMRGLRALTPEDWQQFQLTSGYREDTDAKLHRVNIE